jgi:mRNA interferase MazF
VVLVSRDDAYRVRDFIMVASVLGRIRGIPSEVRLGPAEGLKKPCAANLDSLQTIPKSLLLNLVSHLPDHKMGEIDEALRYSLGLKD